MFEPYQPCQRVHRESGRVCFELHLRGRLSIVRSSNVQASGSIVAPLDNYLNNDICNTDACSQDTISSANQTLNDNCQEDIQSGSTLIVGLQTILKQYSTIREVGCLQASG